MVLVYTKATRNSTNFLPKSINNTITTQGRTLSNGYIRAISEAKDGSLWVGTLEGLNHISNDRLKCKSVSISRLVSPTNNIICLLHDTEDRFWVGTAAGLFLKEEDKFKPIIIDENLNELEIRDIKQSNDGQLWVATENNGVYHFTYNNGKVKQTVNINTSNSALASNSVRKLLLEDTCCWIATLKGVSKLTEKKELTNIQYSDNFPNGISNSSVHDILKDRSGSYWLATYSGGVNYYHSQNNLFTNISVLNKDNSGINDNDITGIAEDNENNIWIGTNTAGLYYWNKEKDTYTHYYTSKTSNLSSNNIKDLSVDSNNNLWVATYHGLNFYDKKRNKWRAFLHENNNNSLNFDQVHAVHCDKDGHVWIGMNGGNFQVYDTNTKTFTTIRGVGKYVEALYQDSKDQLWIGGPKGIKCLNTKTRHFIDISEQTKNVYNQLKNINCITEDTQGRLWVGTKGTGILVLDNGKFFEYDEKDGLNDNIINMILEGSNEQMWISTNQGITQVTFKRIASQLATIDCIHYSTNDGLQGKQFEKGSGCKTSDGHLMFGGIHGINLVLPHKVRKEDYFPKVQLSGFNINKETSSEHIHPNQLRENNTYHLNYEERNISLQFVGIHYIHPEGIHYRYRLNESSDTWIYLGHQRSLNFIDLSPGEYELQIQASSNSQKWDTTFTSIGIVVAPPYWKTWWAYLIYVSLFATIGFLVFKQYSKMMRLKNSLSMAKYKSEHEQLLNESKFRFFTDISHELRTPLTLILGPLEYIIKKERGLDEDSLRQLFKMQHNGSRMLRLVNQVLNLRKMENGYEKLYASQNNLLGMVDVIFKEFYDIAKENDIEIIYQTEVKEAMLWYEHDKIESVLYNLLSNAIKNTPKGEKIELNIKRKIYDNSESYKHQNYIVIGIRNTGKGISSEEGKHLFKRFYSKHDAVSSTGVGLELTKRIVELHHGNIWVESAAKSEENNGFAHFYVALPIGKGHLNENEMVKENVQVKTTNNLALDLLKGQNTLDNITNSQTSRSVNNVTKPTILVVEDNAEMKDFIKDLLSVSYNVLEAANGEDGWKICLELLPDIIISDVMMPISDGIELCKKVKDDVRTSHIPVVLLTARSGKAHHMDGIGSGADDYITKPFSAEFLCLRLENLLRQRKLYKKHYSQEVLLQPETITMSTVDDKLLKKAVDYISVNMEDSHLSVEKLSQEVGLSRVHFYRKIKGLTGFTAVEFIRSIRLKRAATLLDTQSLSIKEIQLKVGFENADYFRKCFKEYYSLTPTEYRQKKMVNDIITPSE